MLLSVGATPVAVYPNGSNSVLVQNLDATNKVYLDGEPSVSSSGANEGVTIMPGGDTGWIPFTRGVFYLVCAAGVTVNVQVASL